MSYPKITSAEINKKDFEGQGDITKALDILADLPFNVVTAVLTAGATGETKDDYVFVAPTKGKIKSVKFLETAANTGAGNTPVVSLRNATSNKELAASAAIALSGSAAGNIVPMTLTTTTADLTFASNDVLLHRIVNPTATITTALAGKLQIEWYSIPD